MQLKSRDIAQPRCENGLSRRRQVTAKDRWFPRKRTTDETTHYSHGKNQKHLLQFTGTKRTWNSSIQLYTEQWEIPQLSQSLWPVQHRNIRNIRRNHKAVFTNPNNSV